MTTTRATHALTRMGIQYTVREHTYDSAAEHKGLQAAEALGESPDHVLKTLIATVDGKPVCVVIPVNRELSMKKLAAAFGGKAAQMVAPADAERITGYVVGGISPFGQKRAIPKAVDGLALAQETIILNGGGRGVQIMIAPGDAVKALDAKVADLVAEGRHLE